MSKAQTMQQWIANNSVAWRVVPYFKLETYEARGVENAAKIIGKIYEDHDEAWTAAQKLDPGNSMIEGLTQERYDRLKWHHLTQ